MRKITMQVVGAFVERRRCSKSNTWSDGDGLYLFGNKIAWWDLNNRLWIDTCGWKSITTKERLNAIPWVKIVQKNHVWYLNGKEWDGNAIRINFPM
jgi:hypothetical protein